MPLAFQTMGSRLCLYLTPLHRGCDLQILKAYETLGDPALRQNYDLSGMKEVRPEWNGVLPVPAAVQRAGYLPLAGIYNTYTETRTI